MTEDLQTSTEAVEEVQDAPIVDEAEIEARKEALAELIEMMRPSVRLDGGDLHLVSADYVTGVVEIILDGACGSCAIAELTLEGGVDRLLKEHLSWVTEVKGGVDETVDPLESAAQGRGAYVPRYY
jgi:Fe-S cluster biogenesis protein NfuA